jgi:hypothetical protein
MKLSAHLDLSEVIRSESAKRNGISNMPIALHIENFKLLAEKVFEPVRVHFGCPIHISSGYRSIELNKCIGGSLTSEHCTGEAIDIDMDGSQSGVTNKMVFDYIKDNLDYNQLIYEFGDSKNPDWVHVSYKATGKQRKQVLRAVRANGKTIYQNY